MRALTWLVGVLVILLGLSIGPAGSSTRAAVWIAAAVLWFFVGAGLGVATLAKIVAGKVGAGAMRHPPTSLGRPPAPKTSQAGPGPAEGFDG